MRKKTVSILLAMVLLVTLLLAACSSKQDNNIGTQGSGKQVNNEKIVIRIGYITPPNSAADKGANKFKEIVEKKSNGRIEVQVFPSSQLGGEQDMMNLIQMGSLEMEITGDGPINVFLPEYGAMTMPFVFRDIDHMKRALKGPIGEEISQALINAKGNRVIDWWVRGPRYLTANKEIKTPDDLKGFKIRVPEMQVYIQTWNRLGANATPMGLSEVYSALQQHVIDGQENPLDIIYTSSFFEVQKYLIKTAHVYGPYLVVIGEQFYQNLPDDLKQIVTESIKQAGDYVEQETLAEQDKLFEELQTKGMTIVEVDRKLFMDKLQGLPQELEEKLNWKPGLYQQIIDVK